MRSHCLPRPKAVAAEPLLNTFKDRRLGFDFDACTSSLGAAQKLVASPYQLIISGAHLAEMNDFLLLKRTQALETVAPRRGYRKGIGQRYRTTSLGRGGF